MMPNLIQKLRKRNVVKSSLSYLIAGWLVLQVLDMLSNFVGYPDWLPRTVLLLLVIGFPFVVAVSWIYEITADGIKKESDLNDADRDPGVSRRFNIVIGILLVTAIGLAVFNAINSNTPSAEIDPVDFEKSIAVLPFTAFSSDENEQHFANGLSDTLLHKLAQLNEIKVISRSSSFQYRGDAVDVREVGQALQVATVLEGSVQRSGDQLRIIAQLVRTDDGSHIWSKTFDRPNDDIFAVQDEIANAVVGSMQVSVSDEEAARLSGSDTRSVEAYNLLTLATEKIYTVPVFGSTPDEYRQEIYTWLEVVDEALEIDPFYADAYRRKSDFYNSLAFRTPNRQDKLFYVEEGKRAVYKAMAVDQDNPENLVYYAMMLRREGNLAGAEAFYRQAIEKLPNNEALLSGLSLTLGSLGKNPEEQLELIEKLRSRQPDSSFVIRQLGFAYVNLGRSRDAAELYEKQINIMSEKQILANDVIFTRSEILGEHLVAARVLKPILDSARMTRPLENALLRLQIFSGLFEEALVHTTVNKSSAEDTFDLLMLMEKFDAAQETIDRVAAETGQPLDPQQGILCLQRQDFKCAVESFLRSVPGFAPGVSQRLEIHSFWDLTTAIDLAVAYRQLDRMEEYSRLMNVIGSFIANQPEGARKIAITYNLPVYYALQGDLEKGIGEMRDRIDLSDDNYVPQLRRFDSPAFDELARHPEFASLVEEYQRRQTSTAKAARQILDL
jgi:TolB-like protein/tetratricopeptide (TPR) repeat protein